MKTLFLAVVLFSSALYAQGLDFEKPALGAKPAVSVGPLQNISFGGAFDTRFFAQANQKSQMMIHVSELVLTTTIGDNISILAEQLLQTDEHVSVVGQDHGFAYAIISNLPYSTSLKIGRFRNKWGLDARSDSPANPVQSLALRSLGQITDIGGEWSGAMADFADFSVSLANNGLYSRLSADLLPSLKFGGSYFQGVTPAWRNGGEFMHETMQVYGVLDTTTLTEKKRAAVDGEWKWEKLTLSGEYGFGSGGFSAASLRADVTILPNQFSGLVQVDKITDGDPTTGDPWVGSAELSANITDQSLVRLFFISNLSNLGDAHLAGAQLLLSF